MVARRTAVGALQHIALLLLVAVGVVSMHTLGHHDGHSPATTSTAAASHSAAGHEPAAVTRDATPEDGPSPASPLWICLAILSSGALLTLLPLLALFTLAPGGGFTRLTPRGLMPYGTSRHGPPLLALVLTRVAVLRI
ncbi:hypothetical protein [Sinosporangium siamense]|uniref:Uncharacterized protein n=1 Tax=Sinosporangium siamense TaxID=1367973 RepID=A0A919REB6_9ACTN|nr:hypothetical protein [Sinosporangium siamense]GII91842.1 hypothetical protein Ssi02_20730 [Sinosporangium siamense]